MGRQQRVARQAVGLRIGVLADLPRQLQRRQATRERDTLMTIGVEHAGGKRPAMLLGQVGVSDVRLGLEERPKHGVAGRVGEGFQIVEGSLRLEHSDIGRWEIEGGELGHRIRCRMVSPADQHAKVAQGRLVPQCGCPIVAYVG